MGTDKVVFVMVVRGGGAIGSDRVRIRDRYILYYYYSSSTIVIAVLISCL
jgi:hypothetical protein